MRLTCLTVLAIFALSCGGDPEPRSSAPAPRPSSANTGNRAPLVGNVRIVPAEPAVGEPVSLSIKVQDPDGDRVTIVAEWFHNGRPFQKGPRTQLETVGFARGDQISVVAYVSDGTEEVVARGPTVRLVNQPPRITSLRVLPEGAGTADDLTVVVQAVDGDGDPYSFEYRWKVNGKELPGAHEPTLAKGTVKRGDEVQVSVLATDAYGDGDWVDAPLLRIANAAPEIVSEPSQALVSGGRYKYAIKAVDPDGDRPLRYQLLEAPEGMTIDLLSGVIAWKVPADAGGSYTVELVVADPHGLETHQRYAIELRWETDPANTR